MMKSGNQLTPPLVPGLVLLPAAASFPAVSASWPASHGDWTWLAGIQDSASVIERFLMSVTQCDKCSSSILKFYDTI